MSTYQFDGHVTLCYHVLRYGVYINAHVSGGNS